MIHIYRVSLWRRICISVYMDVGSGRPVIACRLHLLQIITMVNEISCVMINVHECLDVLEATSNDLIIQQASLPHSMFHPRRLSAFSALFLVYALLACSIAIDDTPYLGI